MIVGTDSNLLVASPRDSDSHEGSSHVPGFRPARAETASISRGNPSVDSSNTASGCGPRLKTGLKRDMF